MDVLKLLEIAGKMNVPGLAAAGIAWVGEVKRNAARAKHLVSDGELAELDAIHEEALSVNDELDRKAGEAAQR